MKTYESSKGAIVVDLVGAVVVGILVMLAYGINAGGIASAAISFFIAFIVLLAMSIRVISEWNRMPVLRLGRYQGIVGPGFVTIIPIIDSTPYTLDLRVISTTFSAEQTLTKDNVPVNVDAILFWQVADPEKTVLNVQSYYDSMQLAAQTALRDIIGKSNLTDMLAGRDVIGKDIQNLIEDRAESWGVKAIQVEIRDVKIPQELQDAMARVATSEREKDARVILAESESLAADKIIEATQKYHKDPYAMQLRALNMMYEISLNGKNLMVFIPTDSRGFSIPTPVGIMGIQDLQAEIKKSRQKPPSKDTNATGDST
ncbi:MAG: slipin family protein [Candidatus Micrarchaeota archaeon]|nr:slipin family protein [Candidatus Micrarchaeota archaeon]